MKDALQQFRTADWKAIQLRLAHYAVTKVQRLAWRTSSGLPRGLQPEDLVIGAIQKTMEGLMNDRGGKGIRRWNPETEPDLLEFLKSVIDSDVSSLVNLEEHKLTNYSPDASPEEALEKTLSAIDQSGAAQPGLRVQTAEELLESREEAEANEKTYQELMKRLIVQCASDEDELKVLKACMQLADADDDQKLRPSLISAKTGLTEERVKNARRRIERKTRMIRDQLVAREGELSYG